MTKKYLPWEQFSLPEQAIDLVKESVRSGIEFDAYGGKTSFVALALTPAYKLTEVEASGYGDATADTIQGTGMKYKFKARIIENNSPHMFLPDPCALAENEDPEGVISAIARHTDFIHIGVDGKNILPGDVVEVELVKNVFSYDLQVGKFKRKLAHNSKAATLLRTTGCSKLAKQFTRLPDAPTVNLTLDDITNISKKNSGVNIQPGVKEFLFELSQKLPLEVVPAGQPNAGKPWIPNSPGIVITDGLRTPQMMAKIVYDYYHDPMYGELYLRELYGRTSFAKGSPNLNDIFNMLSTGGGMEDVARLIFSAFQQTPQRTLSSHQKARGVDIRTNNLSTEQCRALARAVMAVDSSSTFIFEPVGKGVFDNPRTINVTKNKYGTKREHLHITIPRRFVPNETT